MRGIGCSQQTAARCTSHPSRVTMLACTHEAFYVGGSYVKNRAGKHTMQGQMYVEHLAPASRESSDDRAHPLVLIHGGTRTGADWLTKPDGNPGWADYFVSHGYHVYLVDLPYRARSAWEPAVGDVRVASVEQVQERFTACRQLGKWPQAKFHTQWPGTGRMGDPIFDRFYASSVQMVQNQPTTESAAQAALTVLLDRIARPVIFLSHSNSSGVPFLAADRRPRLVEMIVSVEPKGPPFEMSQFNSLMQSSYGICDVPIAYDPPVDDPKVDLVKVVRKAPDPSLMDAVLQAESPPPRKLASLTHIPVLVVTGQASYHAQYDWCTVEYLRQAEVETEHLKLEDRNILGNGHMMFMESNSDEIAAEIDAWIRGRCCVKDESGKR